MTIIEPIEPRPPAWQAKASLQLGKRLRVSQLDKSVEDTPESGRARPGISKLRQMWGYLKGYPFSVLPLAVGSLAAAVIRRDEKGQKNALVLIEMMGRGADFFTCMIWYLRGFYSISDPYHPAQYFALEDPQFPLTKPREIVLDELRLQYGVDDFDAPERRMSPRYRLLYFLLRRGPGMQPDHLPLPSLEAYQAMLRNTFGKTFVAYRPIRGDANSPFVLCRYMTHDYGAPWLRREGDDFVADLSHWEGLGLKGDGKNYESYGGRLRFDAGMKNVSITWKGKRYAPGDPEWPKVRFIFTSTVLVSVVLEYHTLQVHYLNSALFALKVRTHLGNNHRIARLLRPFTLRTVSINEHAIHSILTQSGILFHGTALTWESMKKLYARAAAEYRHVPLPDQLRLSGLLEPDGSAAPGVAFAEEGLLLYGIIDSFVRSYVGLYYANDRAILEDAALTEFYSEIRAGMPHSAGIPSQPSLGALVDLLAVFIWNCTFWHDFTSQTGNSLADYRLGAVLIKREDVYGTYYPNLQEHLVTLLAHQLTTVEGNKVVDNFHKFWADERSRELALEFQKRLWSYRDELKERNEKRDFVFNAYDPVVIETSVQT